MRKHGLASDNLIGADVVTADGRHVHCDEDENRELLWGLRGGGGNFGVVTSLEFRLHPVGPMVLAGPIFFDGRRAQEILDFYRTWVPTLPDDVGTLVNLTTAPPAPFLPVEVHGKPIVAVVVAHAGEHEAGRQALAPLKALGDPIADLVGVMPYAGLQSMLDALYPRGVHNYFRAAYIDRIDDATLARLVLRHERIPSPMSEIHVQHLGGAMARGGQDAAFGDRSAQFVVNVIARTPDVEGFDDNVRWARADGRRPRAGQPGRLVRQLHGRRRRHPPPRLVRRRQLRPSGRAQAPLRPGQPVPPQPEHQPAIAEGPTAPASRRPGGRSARLCPHGACERTLAIPPRVGERPRDRRIEGKRKPRRFVGRVRCAPPRQERGWRTEGTPRHQQHRVQEHDDPVGRPDVIERDVVVGPHLSDEHQSDGKGEIGWPEREKAMQQVHVLSRGMISRTGRVMVMARRRR